MELAFLLELGGQAPVLVEERNGALTAECVPAFNRAHGWCVVRVRAGFDLESAAGKHLGAVGDGAVELGAQGENACAAGGHDVPDVEFGRETGEAGGGVVGR